MVTLHLQVVQSHLHCFYANPQLKLVDRRGNAPRLFRCERKVLLLSLSAHFEIGGVEGNRTPVRNSPVGRFLQQFPMSFNPSPQ